MAIGSRRRCCSSLRSPATASRPKRRTRSNPKPLRLCADPANLPFSSADSKTPGLYLEIGEAIGRAIGRAVTPVWNLTYFGKRAVRTTLLAGKCDASIGLPLDADFMGPRVIFSKPLLKVGYALVAPNSVAVAGLDELKGRRVAVQFATTPQSLLASRDDIQMVTYREPEEAMGALATGQVDAAFIWGPIAGYVNKTRLDNAFHVVSVIGPGLQWPAAIGFASGQTGLAPRGRSGHRQCCWRDRGAEDQIWIADRRPDKAGARRDGAENHAGSDAEPAG